MGENAFPDEVMMKKTGRWMMGTETRQPGENNMRKDAMKNFEERFRRRNRKACWLEKRELVKQIREKGIGGVIRSKRLMLNKPSFLSD